MVGVKAGSTASVEDDIARIAAVREAVGKGFAFMTDANQAWDCGQGNQIRQGDRKI